MSASIEHIATELRACTAFDDLSALFIEQYAREGVTMMSYHHLPPPGASDYSQPITVAAHGFPENWVKQYVDKQYYLIDPIPKHALSLVYPFWWSDIAELTDLSEEEKSYIDALNKADLGDGIAISLFGPHGRNGYTGLGGGQKEKNWDAEKIARLHLMAQLGHMQYCHILHAHAPSEIRLSSREKEILEWVARGKSNSVIADILGLSSNTIDTYMRRVFEKLDVADRVTAALRGLAVGVIG